MKTLPLLLLALALSCLALAQSAAAPDRFFTSLQGAWRGEGTAFEIGRAHV